MIAANAVFTPISSYEEGAVINPKKGVEYILRISSKEKNAISLILDVYDAKKITEFSFYINSKRISTFAGELIRWSDHIFSGTVSTALPSIQGYLMPFQDIFIGLKIQEEVPLYVRISLGQSSEDYGKLTQEIYLWNREQELSTLENIWEIYIKESSKNEENFWRQTETTLQEVLEYTKSLDSPEIFTSRKYIATYKDGLVNIPGLISSE